MTGLARPPSRGFTLIEVLIALACFGVLVVLVAPQIDSEQYAIVGGLGRVGTRLRAAQRHAVTRHHNVIVAFDTAAVALRVLDDTNNNATADPGEHLRVLALEPDVVFGLGGAAPLGAWTGPVSFTQRLATLPAVTFHRDGSASEAGVIYLTTVRAATQPGYAGDTRALQIERGTARGSWFRAAPPNWVRGF
jgi:prepilin-type N-terminal cleavage/methylation domain-containing protein